MPHGREAGAPLYPRRCEIFWTAFFTAKAISDVHVLDIRVTGPDTGQRWAQSGVLSYITGGWSANYLFQARSGQAYNLSVGGDLSNISGDNGSVTGYSRPNTATHIPCSR
jgi:hypothetical protein